MPYVEGGLAGLHPKDAEFSPGPGPARLPDPADLVLTASA